LFIGIPAVGQGRGLAGHFDHSATECSLSAENQLNFDQVGYPNDSVKNFKGIFQSIHWECVTLHVWTKRVFRRIPDLVDKSPFGWTGAAGLSTLFASLFWIRRNDATT
jgi:hypothetical protein